jgi:membrane associated rhomboid family serine protease
MEGNITLVIVLVTTLISILAFRRKELLYRFDLAPYKVKHHRQFYRILSHAFLHADYLHLAINMLVLYSFGTGIERIFAGLQEQGVIFSGSLSFILLYLLSVVLASVTTVIRYRDDPGYSSIGASGAVSAVVFAYIFFAPLQKIYFYAVLPIPGILFGVLYLGYSSYMSRRNTDNVNHSAHFWGAVVGFLFPLLLEPRLLGVFFENFLTR